MSRFVSAGTGEDPPQRDAEWLEAQKEIEAAQLRKKQEANPDDGRSLYEVLQANKAAKQEAFEEAAKLKNQFRSLDDDEVDFLDSVLESTRAKEEAVKKETTEQLELFRRQREEAGKAGLGLGQDSTTDALNKQEQWTASGARKRKKGPEKAGFKGLKVRRSSLNTEGSEAFARAESATTKAKQQTSSTEEVIVTAAATRPVKAVTSLPSDTQTVPPSTAKEPRAPTTLGLAAYSDSDED